MAHKSFIFTKIRTNHKTVLYTLLLPSSQKQFIRNFAVHWSVRSSVISLICSEINMQISLTAS